MATRSRGEVNHRGVLVVDVYNVLHTQGVLPPHLAGPEVHELADLIGASRFRRHRAILVCDGVPGADARGPAKGASVGSNEVRATSHREERREGTRGGGHVDVVFAGPGREADEAIEALLQSHSAARRMVVVSTDRRVRRAAAKAGAASVTSAEFLGQLAADVERNKGAGLSRRPGFATDLPLGRVEVAYWLAHMGVEAGEPGQEAQERIDRAESVESAHSKGHPEAKGAKLPREGAGVPMGVKGGGSGHRPRDGAGESRESAREAANTQADAARDGAPAWMNEAVRAWAGRLNLEELDTGKWLDSPLAPDPTHARSPRKPARRKK